MIQEGMPMVKLLLLFPSDDLRLQKQLQVFLRVVPTFEHHSICSFSDLRLKIMNLTGLYLSGLIMCPGEKMKPGPMAALSELVLE